MPGAETRPGFCFSERGQGSGLIHAMTPRFKVKDVEDALRASLGIRTAAAAILKKKYGSCSPNTVKNYILKHPKLQAVLDDVLDQNLDVAESKILKWVNEGNLKAVIFFLTTKGKHRGWVRRVENTGADGGPVKVENVGARELLADRISDIAARSEEGEGTRWPH